MYEASEAESEKQLQAMHLEFKISKILRSRENSSPNLTLYK